MLILTNAGEVLLEKRRAPWDLGRAMEFSRKRARMASPMLRDVWE